MNVDEGQTFRKFIVGSSNRRAVECIPKALRSRFVCEVIEARRVVCLASVKLWPALFDELARWDADVVPVSQPSLAQRKTAVIRRGRRRLTTRKLIEIARSATTIGVALATLEAELLANELGAA